MPTDTALEVMRDEFTAIFTHQAQQMTSRLTPFVHFRPYRGENTNYRGVKDAKVQDISGKNPDIVYNNPEFENRIHEVHERGIPLILDSNQVKDMLTDVNSPLISNMVAEMQRERDRIIAVAAIASVRTGKNGATTITAATDGVRTVDATAGLTHAKFLEAIENWIDDDVINEDGGDMKAALAHAGKEHTAMLNITEVTSGDFTRNFVLEDARVKKAYGLKTIAFGANATDPVLDVTGGVRSNILMRKGAVWMEQEETSVELVDMKETKWHSYGLKVYTRYKVVRTEGPLVQIVTTTA